MTFSNSLMLLCKSGVELLPVFWEWYGLLHVSRLFCSSLVSASDSLPTECLLYTVHGYHNLASSNLICCPPPTTTVCTRCCVLIFIKASGNALQWWIRAEHTTLKLVVVLVSLLWICLFLWGVLYIWCIWCRCCVFCFAVCVCFRLLRFCFFCCFYAFCYSVLGFMAVFWVLCINFHCWFLVLLCLWIFL